MLKFHQNTTEILPKFHLNTNEISVKEFGKIRVNASEISLKFK